MLVVSRVFSFTTPTPRSRACRPAGSGACQQVAANFSDDYSATAGIVTALLQAVPALIGAFAGAPLLAGVFESGTFHTCSPRASVAPVGTAKLVSLAVVVGGRGRGVQRRVLVGLRTAPRHEGLRLQLALLAVLRPAGHRVRRLDARRLRNRRARGRADPPGPTRDVRHAGRVVGTGARDGAAPSPALPGAATDHEPEHRAARSGHQPMVDTARQARRSVRSEHGPQTRSMCVS